VECPGTSLYGNSPISATWAALSLCGALGIVTNIQTTDYNETKLLHHECYFDHSYSSFILAFVYNILFRKQHTKIFNQTGDHFLSSSGHIFSMHLNIRHRQSLWGSGTIVRSHQIFLSKFTLNSFSLVSSFTKIWQKQRLFLSFPNQLGKASQINLQMFHCVYWVVIYFIY
jgi:hypothetical protein